MKLYRGLLCDLSNTEGLSIVLEDSLFARALIRAFLGPTGISSSSSSSSESLLSSASSSSSSFSLDSDCSDVKATKPLSLVSALFSVSSS